MVKDKVIAIIPARYQSSRFPGKPLVLLAGKPLIFWVYSRAKAARIFQRVIVATDDQRIAQSVVGFGGEVLLTPPGLDSGTTRVAWAWQRIKEKGIAGIVNLQGDEPLFPLLLLRRLARGLINKESQVISAVYPARNRREYEDPNVVKVALDRDSFALYFSRSPIPYARNKTAPLFFYKHLGVYAFQPETLSRFVHYPPGRLERIEMLEQLRLLERGIRIKMIVSRQESFGIDTPADLKRIVSKWSRLKVENGWDKQRTGRYLMEVPE